MAAPACPTTKAVVATDSELLSTAWVVAVAAVLVKLTLPVTVRLPPTETLPVVVELAAKYRAAAAALQASK